MFNFEEWLRKHCWVEMLFIDTTKEGGFMIYDNYNNISAIGKTLEECCNNFDLIVNGSRA